VCGCFANSSRNDSVVRIGTTRGSRYAALRAIVGIGALDAAACRLTGARPRTRRSTHWPVEFYFQATAKISSGTVSPMGCRISCGISGPQDFWVAVSQRYRSSRYRKE
jgi:hypothetical protein